VIVHRRRRAPQNVLLMVGPLGLTLWRDGALSLQVCGRFVQLVFGDWWKAMPKR
jgi:hypothetical protein